MRLLLSQLIRHRIGHTVSTLSLLAVLALGGCGPFLMLAVPATGVIAVQERSIGNAVDDLTIRAELNQIFFEDNIDLLQSVSFNVIEGQVLLMGSVEKPETRVHAMKLAWQVGGVREVINEIQVTDLGSVINLVRDSWISTQLTADIMFDNDIRAINYNVETVNGVIYLAGIAQDQQELDKVVDHAHRIKYVQRLVSHVQLKNAPHRKQGT